MSKFESKILVDCLDSLIDYRGKTPKKSENGIPTLSAKSVKMGEIFYDRAFYISPETYNKFMVRGIPKKGDVLLTTEAPLGCVARLDRDDVGLAQRLITLRGKNNILDNGYLMYYLMSPIGQYELKNRATGTTVQGIKRSEFEKVLIKLPPLPEQKAIAHILGTLDDKIELNRKMNQTLEAMAQALFKSWFVDFDPVLDNALAAGNPIPDELEAMAEKRRSLIAKENVIASGAKQSRRLIDTNPELAALFPSSFAFNEVLGKWIPEGWEVKKLESISPCNKNSWTNRNSPKQVDYVDLSNTKNGDILETTIYSYEEAPSRAKRILKIGDTIFGTVRPGNRSFAYIGKDGLTGSTGFAVLSPSKIEYRAFTYLYATQEEMIELFAHLADGAAYPSINSSVIAESHIVYSGDVLLSRFENLAGSNISKMMSNKIESETLTQLRERLLPELISGRVRVINIKY